MYKKVNSSLNFVENEKEILEFWKENKIFEKSMEKDSEGKNFSFYDGPPTANGKPHIGHILTRVIKDIIPRYKTMQGYHVDRKAGWDTHGLPVELEVEKVLNLDGKQDIENYGIEPFIKKCKESVWKYTSEWEKMSDRVGYWVDMEHPYVTYDDNYIESVWWAIKQIYDKGLLYKGHKIVPYCPRCGTALSSHEVAQGYKEVEEISIFVRFKAKEAENTYFLAWTTTPWTLPSNVALCMNPDENYVLIQAEDGKKYILAENLVSTHFENYKVLETKKGLDYEGMAYEPLFDYAKPNKKSYYVTCDNYVTLTDGTGIVHIAPAFGEDDANVGRKYDLPFVQMVNDRGEFVAEATDFAGMKAKSADKPIIAMLKDKDLLFKELPFTHSYPHCWRCDTPLLYYARTSWFVKMTAVKEQLLKNNATVNWLPKTIGTGRMGNFLENVIDWGISRERYWGTPLPVWVCKDCGEIHVVGSRDELREASGLKENIELHRPYLDEVKFTCDACGGEMIREKEVIDCWFDSGSMPFAQFHYPFENKELFEKNFPADFISEAVDQTRGWFYTLLAISTLLFDKAPFKNCIVLGHVNDKDGIKMSKHKGNVVDPFSVLDKQGADAVRWYFYTISAPWIPSRFHGDAVSEAQRKFMGTFWNTYAFFVLYAEIDKFNPAEYKLKDCKLALMDKWVLSRLNTLVRNVSSKLDEYNIIDAGREIQNFTDDLSNWYVRRCRERYWGKEMTEDKKSAYVTLYTVLTTMSKTIAPFTPFMAESVYQNLVANFFENEPRSVHMCEFPKCDESLIDEKLEQSMSTVLDVVVLGRSARNNANIKNRQPLGKMFVACEEKTELDAEYIGIIAEELNIKNVEFTSEKGKFVTYSLKPQLRTLGAKYGKVLNVIRTYLAECDADAVVSTVKSGSKFNVTLEGVNVELAEEDLLISTISREGYVSVADKGITVVLDTNLTEELLREGLMREIISKIQTMRKEADYEVVNHINLQFSGSEKIEKIFEENGEEIKSVILCDNVSKGTDGEFVKEWDVNGEKVVFAIAKV